MYPTCAERRDASFSISRMSRVPELSASNACSNSPASMVPLLSMSSDFRGSAVAVALDIPNSELCGQSGKTSEAGRPLRLCRYRSKGAGWFGGRGRAVFVSKRRMIVSSLLSVGPASVACAQGAELDAPKNVSLMIFQLRSL